MVAGVGGVVAGRAGAGDAGHVEVVVEPLDAGDRDRLGVEQGLAASDGAAGDGHVPVAAFLVGATGVEDVRLPAVVQRHHVRREAGVAAVVAGQGVVDAEVADLALQERRPAAAAVHREAAGVVVAHLRRREAHCEGDDGLALRRADRRRGLGVAERGAVRLIDEVEVQARETGRGVEDAAAASSVAEGLAAVPHHGAEEAQVGRRQRPPEQRKLGRRREAVGVVDLDQLELGIGRNRQADPNDAAREQHAVRLLARRPRRDIGVGRVGAVDEAKDRVGAVRGLEALANAARRDRPAFGSLVARAARAAVGAEAGEERAAAVDAAGPAQRQRGAARVAVQLAAVGAAIFITVIALARGRGWAGGERANACEGRGDGPETHVSIPSGVMLRRHGRVAGRDRLWRDKRKRTEKAVNRGRRLSHFVGTSRGPL